MPRIFFLFSLFTSLFYFLLLLTTRFTDQPSLSKPNVRCCQHPPQLRVRSHPGADHVHRLIGNFVRAAHQLEGILELLCVDTGCYFGERVGWVVVDGALGLGFWKRSVWMDIGYFEVAGRYWSSCDGWFFLFLFFYFSFFYAALGGAIVLDSLLYFNSPLFVSLLHSPIAMHTHTLLTLTGRILLVLYNFHLLYSHT